MKNDIPIKTFVIHNAEGLEFNESEYKVKKHMVTFGTPPLGEITARWEFKLSRWQMFKITHLWFFILIEKLKRKLKGWFE